MKTYKQIVKDKTEEVRNLVGSLSEIEEKIMGKQLLESIAEVLNIFKEIIGVSSKSNGKEIITYSYETLPLKQLMDLQFKLAGHLGFISTELARYKGQAGLKKAQVDLVSNYLYTDTKNYISEILQERATEKYIFSIINTELVQTYAIQRVSASIATILETIYRAGELARNVLNSVIIFYREDLINSVHLTNSQV